ncbi:hypothetical protein NOCD_14120 [Nocardioides cavernae]|uniref:hypothetical protein n=1 Tax=Nocardioides TaxID=1839 RepID=UPI000A927F8C|nr:MULTISPECIES: hypothetical protein [Nocardioides]MCK9824617.1 hypothetical protein [Nocardioides cavernae]
MSTTVPGLTSPAGRTIRRRVLPALVRTESLRLLRNPVPWLGLALSVWALWTTVPEPGEWPGSSYEGVTPTVAPLLFGISVAVATTFHRGRTEVAPAAPVQEARRALARLLAALPFLVVTAGFAALIGWREHDLGGLWLGMEPGRTTEAFHTVAELSQHVALGLVAVALGAALGRRVSRLAAVLPALFVLWFVAMTYWLFGARSVTPFSVIQVQPVPVPVGPPSTDPLSLPADWLLVGPPHTSGWDRQLVSESLAWWHDVWLLGLALLLLAVAWPSEGRRRLAAAGLVLAVLGVVGQQVVIP